VEQRLGGRGSARVLWYASMSIVPELRVAFRERVIQRRVQRLLDLLVAFLAVAVTAPVVLAAAVAIWLEDRGPILFHQRRVGRFERYFTLYKLRTMHTDMCGDGLKPGAHGDRRITRVGRILRKTSIDELPQLINVLRGDMSIIGPRPEQPFLVKRYAKWQHLRHLIKPGITGLWQVTCRSTPLHEPASTRVDLEYIRTASMATDARIAIQTFVVVMFLRGAY
jgi:undecaprenyl phosphate N,N'-diacetylbacillosamine 1-phosphate transferase